MHTKQTKIPGIFKNSAIYFYCQTDRDLNIIRANELFLKTFGIQTAKDNNKALFEILFLPDNANAETLKEKIKAVDFSSGRLETISNLQSGASIEISWEITCEKDAVSKIEKLTFLGIDRTNSAKYKHLDKAKNAPSIKLRHYQALFKNTREAFYMVDRSLRVVIMNDASKKILLRTTGREVNEGDCIMDKIPSERKEHVLHAFNAAMSGISKKYEVLEGTAEDILWLMVHFAPARSEDGMITGVVVSLIDITEQKIAEEKVAKNDENFRVVLDMIGDNVWEHDFDTGMTYFSERIFKLIGFSNREFGDKADLWWNQTHEKDRWMLEDNDRNYKAGLIDHHSKEYRVLHKDGSVIWVMDRGAAIEKHPDGRPKRIIGTHTDITKIKESEKALAESDARFRAIFNSSHQFIGLTTPEGIVLEANETVLNYSQLHSSELIGRHLWEAYWWQIDRQTVDKIKKAIAVAATGQLVNFEVEVEGLEENVWIDFSIKPVKDEKENVIFLVAEGRNITQNKQAEKELIKAEHLFRSFMENTPIIAWILDEDNIFRYLNKPYKTAFHLTDNAVGRSIYEIFPENICDTYVANNHQVWEAGAALETIEQSIGPDGANIILQVFKFPLESGDGKKLIGGTALDITDQIRSRVELFVSNERYEYAVKATSDAVWDWDLKENIIYRGEGFKTLFGYDEARSTVEMQFGYIHPEDRNRVLKELEKTLAGTFDRWQTEYRFKCSDDSYKMIVDKAYIIRNEEKKATRMIGAMKDVTEEKRLQDIIIENENNKKREIIQAIIDAQEKERSEISYELHDNVNQILSTCNLMLDVIKSESDTPHPFLVHCQQNLQQAIEEIRQLCYGLTPVALKDLGLITAINDVVEKLNKSKKIKAVFQVKKSFSEKPITPQVKLAVFRIVQEQLSNALKHSGATEFNIKLEMGQKTFSLEVWDNGKGFDMSKAQKGLGLKNIFNRVEYNRGVADIITSPGNGCKLVVHMPCSVS